MQNPIKSLNMCLGTQDMLCGQKFECPLKSTCVRHESKEIVGVDYFLQLPYQRTESKCNFYLKKKI